MTQQVVVHKNQESGDLEDQLNIIGECEAMALEAWKRMAHAVKAIYDGKLWQQGGHKSFEACMDANFGWQKSHAYRLMHAGDVLETIPAITSIRQAEVLHPLSDDRRVEVWRTVTADGAKPTEKALEAAAAGSDPMPPASRPELAPKPQPSPAQAAARQEEPAGDADEMFADLGNPEQPPWESAIPPDCAGFDAVVKAAKDLRTSMDQLAKSPAGAFLSAEQLRHGIDGLLGLLKWGRPAVVCPNCQGDESEQCEPCANKRWVSQGRLDSMPKSMGGRR